MLCDGREIIQLANQNPFGSESLRPDQVRFVSILPKAVRVRAHPSLPLSLPAEREWFVRVLASTGQFAFGVYRRHMKTITYLGEIDSVFRARATTRNWNTVIAIARILEAREKKAR